MNDKENCSNVSDSRQLTIETSSMTDKKINKEFECTRLVLDQNGSKVYGHYSTSLYTLERGEIQ